MKKNIEFYSEGSLVKGILYLPDNYRENEKMPAILLCHGFAGVKELLLPIEFYNKTMDKYPELNIKIPFLTIMETMEHKPEKYLESIHVPILIIAAGNDKVNPKQESEILYQKANEPKQLHIVKGASHYEVYEGEFFNEVAAKQLAWFIKYLPPDHRGQKFCSKNPKI